MTPKGLLLVGGPPRGAPSEVVNSDHTIPHHLVSPWMACAINFENYTIITGGWYSRHDVKQLDVEENVKKLPRLLEERWSHGCGYHYDGDIRILVVAGGGSGGGDPPIHSTELLRDGADSWVFGTNLPRILRKIGSVSMGNKIFLLGGYDGNQARSEVLSYNGSSWAQSGNLTIPRSSHAGTIIRIDTSGPLDISACFRAANDHCPPLVSTSSQ